MGVGGVQGVERDVQTGGGDGWRTTRSRGGGRGKDEPNERERDGRREGATSVSRVRASRRAREERRTHPRLHARRALVRVRPSRPRARRPRLSARPSSRPPRAGARPRSASASRWSRSRAPRGACAPRGARAGARAGPGPRGSRAPRGPSPPREAEGRGGARHPRARPRETSQPRERRRAAALAPGACAPRRANRSRPRTTSRTTEARAPRAKRARTSARNATSRTRAGAPRAADLPREIHARAKRARADAGAVMGGQSRGITLVGALKPVQIVGSADMSCTKVKVWRSTIDRIQVR